MNDLNDYLNSMGISVLPANYEDLIPRTARPVERQLYVTDLETVLELMRLGLTGGFHQPES